MVEGPVRSMAYKMVGLDYHTDTHPTRARIREVCGGHLHNQLTRRHAD